MECESLPRPLMGCLSVYWGRGKGGKAGVPVRGFTLHCCIGPHLQNTNPKTALQRISGQRVYVSDNALDTPLTEANLESQAWKREERIEQRSVTHLTDPTHYHAQRSGFKS